MAYRSWLIVPGDSEEKLGKAQASGADVVVVDLEASVPVRGKQYARQFAGNWLKEQRKQSAGQPVPSRWVRINGLDSRVWRDDIVAMMPGAPEGIILPRAAGPDAVRQLAAELYELEQVHQIAPGSTRILPQVGETPQSAMSISAYIDSAMPRLGGLAWNADSLAAALSASRVRDGRGGWNDVSRFVRAQTLLVAYSCAIMPIETMLAEVDDSKTVIDSAREARADGFCGMLTCHAAHVADINAAFTPSEEEIEAARRIVAAFEAPGTQDGVSIDRRSTGQPQLKLAKQALGLTVGRSQDNQRVPILRTT